CAADCNGVFGGTASLDNCGTCTGGNTGIAPCAADCNGVFGGTASLDNCGTCTGGNTGIAPCAADCNGVFGGTASLDNCGTCTGGNTGIAPCAADCNGVFGGTASLDNCGTCTGGNTGIAPCVADCNGDFGGTALPGSACDDLDACTTGDVYDANCLCAGTFADADGDGTCDAQDLCANGPEPGTACDDGDTNTVNDVIDANCTCTGYPVSTCDEEKLVLSITLDNFGSQTTWEIRTADEAFVVASGGPYADGQAGTTISETMCVDHGCYKLRVHDANGDGILNGGYVLRDGNSNRIIDANGNFTYVSYLGRKFCLPVSATTLLANSCDLVNVINTDMVQCTTVAGASAYQFWIFDPHGNNEWGFTRTNPVLGPAPLAMIPPGLNLNVRVRAVVNGSNRPFGPACRISTAGVPEFQQHVARDIDESKGEFQAWPNPNNGDRLSISLTGADADAENADVVLYDATGRKVFATSLAMANGMLGTELELGNLGTGVYMLRITAGGQSYESRVSVVNH
ncbi:MAG: T9SS type A sorting domain-containing protein, partial [Flavobacteriales bacterium]